MRNSSNSSVSEVNKSTPLTGTIPQADVNPIRERLRGSVDRPFLILVLILVAFGSVMVFSASYSVSGAENNGDCFYYARKQLLFASAGIVLMMLISFFADYKFVKKFAWPIFILSLLVCYCVAIVPGFGVMRGGATRWIDLGFTTLQPSEILKFGIILVCASYINKYYDKMNIFWYGILPFIFIVGFSAVSLALQPHLSGAIIVCALVFCMMLVGGSNFAWLGTAALACVTLLVSVLPRWSHAQKRIEIWQDPFSDFRGSGWQPAQSLHAIASGGLWGVGLGKSTQKLGYLPEPQNDYIFSIVCEELGFVGAVVVIVLFAMLVWRGFIIAKKAPSIFSSMLVMGIILEIGIHVVLNILVVTNTIPSTGISLPFFSYGGSSLMMLLCEMGVVLSVSRYSFSEK